MKTYYLSSYEDEGKIVVKRDDTHMVDSTHLNIDDLESFTVFESQHTHDFYEISYVISGSGIQIVNDIRYFVQKGDVIYLNPNDYHTYYSINNLIILSILVAPEIIEDQDFFFKDQLTECGKIKLPFFIRFQPDDFLKVESIMLMMENEYNLKQTYYEFSLYNHLQLLMIELFRASEKITKVRTNTNFNAILTYISENLSSVTLTSTAKFSNYNPSYLSKLFHDIMGITFVSYVNQLRINKAIKLILTTNQTIESICYSLGYKEKKNFYSLFKKRTGLTPQALRKEINQ